MKIPSSISPIWCILIIMFFMGTMQSMQKVNVEELAKSIDEKQLPIFQQNVFPFNKITTGIFLTIEGFALFALQLGQKTIALPDGISAALALFTVIVFVIITIFGITKIKEFVKQYLPKKIETKTIVNKI